MEANKRREEFLVWDLGRRKTKRDLSSFRSYLTYEGNCQCQREYKRQQQKRKKKSRTRTNRKHLVDFNTNLSVTILNVNGLNDPLKRQISARIVTLDQKVKMQIYAVYQGRI